MSRNDILSYETMRYVALEIVQLGRDVPEAQWFEDAEHYATSLIRRLCEEAYDDGRRRAAAVAASGCASDTAAKRATKSPDGKPTLVRSDIFLHPDAHTLELLRTAIERGLEPTGMDFGGDGGTIAVLRFTRAKAEPDAASGRGTPTTVCEPEQRHRLHRAEGHARRASAGDSGRADRKLEAAREQRKNRRQSIRNPVLPRTPFLASDRYD